jgi:methylthioribulose-1-phosphate dehydratase
MTIPAPVDALLNDPHHREQRARLVETIRFLHSRGWAPATSSNYSIRASDSLVCISRSGVDKSYFSEDDLMYVDLRNTPVWPLAATPSAETGLHTVMYRLEPTVHCVLHTHSVANTVLSMRNSAARKLVFQGYELQKALPRQQSHDDRLTVPIFANTQNIPTLAREVETYWNNTPEFSSYLIAGHGLYTWGDSIHAAKRHVEAIEFLLECYSQVDLYRAMAV